jgi:hypothetical protein
MLRKRIRVGIHERFVLTSNGQFAGILMPGNYSIFTTSGVSLDMEKHEIRDVVFRSAWSEYLVRQRPELVRQHFTCVETTHAQVALVFANESLLEVMTPAKRLLLWRGAAEIRSEIVDVIAWPTKRASKRRASLAQTAVKE